MNVFSKYTLKTLGKNRTRTIVTIIGIILSVAMFTAVTESIVSGQQYLLNSAKASIGAFEAQLSDLSAEDVEKLRSDEDFKEVATLQNIGYAEIGSKNQYKPYLYICGISENFRDLVAVNLMEGRMPEKSDEIVLPRHLYTNGKVDYRVGDKLTLEVGDRQKVEGLDEEIDFYDPGNEKLVNIKTKEYTVVGICERTDRLVEHIDNPGFMAFALPENDSGRTYRAYFTLKDAKNIYDLKFEEEKGFGSFCDVNYDLLMFSGVDKGSPIMSVIYGLGAILIAIIMLGSVALIYNSFSISVSERTKQFGLLRSVGATKKQMIRTVLTEALILCAVAVPLGLLSGCVGIGVTFKLLSSQFAMILGDEVDTSGTVTMKLIPNAYALLVAALISVATALVSAYIPAKRAMRMPAIEAIRMSNDIKIRGEKLRTGKTTSKLFGFEGMLARKNFKRNKKKYRTTVISLAMSLILFISASSLCYFFQKSFDMDINAIEYDILAMTSPNDFKTNKDARDALDEISKTQGVDDLALTATVDNTFAAKYEDINPEGLTNYLNAQSEYACYVCARYFVSDEAFNKLLKDNGLNEKDYYDKDSPMALLYDKRNYQTYDEETKRIITHQVHVFEVDKFPAELNIIELREEKDGMVNNGFDENGKVVYSNAEKDAFYDIEDCVAKSGVRVGAKLSDNPFFLQNSSTAILYPESMMEAVLGKIPERIYYYGYFKATEYNKVYEKMLKAADAYGEGVSVENEAEDLETIKALMTLIRVFSYGFITLISLIAAANVFNTISTNIMLRRRELAMLKSVGMSDKGFKKMMSYESLLYGIKSILLGLPLSLALTYLIYYVVSGSGFDMKFSLPLGNILFALLSVFIVVFASMIYSVKKIRKYNTADELKNENL